ncbi:MAG: hypothetical protein AAGE84_12085 [Cyanobacteria bacterium P01_G01_bin.39]
MGTNILSSHVSLYSFDAITLIQTQDSGVLVSHDGEPYDEGVSFRDLAVWVKNSVANKIVLVLDCCHAGAADIRNVNTSKNTLNLFSSSDLRNLDTLGKGKVLLASCTDNEKAREDLKLGHGIFTYHFLQACKGKAANKNGEVNITNVYSYICSQITYQTPVFKGEIEGNITLFKLQFKTEDKAKNHKLQKKIRVVHALPPIPRFVGREEELQALQNFVSNQAGIFSVIGIGGSGKTAIIQYFMERLYNDNSLQFDGIFIWSFYEDQSISYFLQETYLFFSRVEQINKSGFELLYRLTELLTSGRKNLLVLDGLETVQRPKTDSEGIFGRIDDRLLKIFLTSIAADPGKIRCIITSRFDIPDLEPWLDKSYWHIKLQDLDTKSAISLLKSHKIKDDDLNLEKIILEYGTHSLTLDHLGSYIAEFCSCDPKKIENLPEPDLSGETKTERKLAKVLYAYQRSLQTEEIDVLSRLCIFRLGVTFDSLFSIFVNKKDSSVSGSIASLSRQDFQKIINRLIKLHLIDKGTEQRFFVHPAVKDYFYRNFSNPENVHNVVREYFSSLVKQPGSELPTNKITLDRIEELIFHTIKVGKLKDAVTLYQSRLGGVEHLGWTLGEFDRGKRILNIFLNEGNDSSFFFGALRDMGLYLRALGDLELATKFFSTEEFSGLIYILQGDFQKVLNINVDKYRSIHLAIKYLQGYEATIPYPIVTSTSMLMASEPRHFLPQVTETEIIKCRKNWLEKGWNDDVSRADLILAEINRLNKNLNQSLKLIQQAERWIFASGSQEHICLIWHIKAKIAFDSNDIKSAESMNIKAINIARECGFDFYLIDFLNFSSELKLRKSETNAALALAREVLIRSTDIKCKYLWATATSSHLIGEALLLLNQKSEAISNLTSALQLREKLGDNRYKMTQKLLDQIYNKDNYV